MNQDSKRKLENQLLVMGLKRLRDPELIAQLAGLVNRWWGDRHEFLMQLINECEPENRWEMYTAIVPHLSFKPLPLDTYISQMAAYAGAMVSQRRMRVEGQAPRSINVGGHNLAVVPQAEATSVVATLTCHKCGTKAKFHEETAAGAMIAGRKAGWSRDPVVNKELCPQCPPTEVLSPRALRVLAGNA